jgi:hypothetical protein
MRFNSHTARKKDAFTLESLRKPGIVAGETASVQPGQLVLRAFRLHDLPIFRR